MSEKTEAQGLQSKVLEKVRKLLAQAESASKFGTEEGNHEAEVFMGKAQELIAENAITQAMLNEGNAKDRGEVITRNLRVEAPHAKIKCSLLNQIGKVNHVQTIMSSGSGKHVTAIMVGFESDLDSVDLLFTSLLIQVTNEVMDLKADSPDYYSAAQKAVATNNFRYSFLAGFTEKIRERLREAQKMAEAKVQESYSSSVALVLADRNQMVSAKVKELFPHLGTSRSRRSRDGRGYAAGQAAGSRANIGQKGLKSRKALKA